MVILSGGGYNSCMTKKLATSEGGSSNIFMRTVSSVKFIVTVAIVVLIAACVAWQYHNMNNVDRIFWGAVNNNLQTTAYTRHSTMREGGQSVDQTIQATTEPKARVFGETVFIQTGVDSTRAVTENIGTPVYDYVRYTDIVTSAKGQRDGKLLDFSGLLHIWGVTEPEDPNETRGQLYNQATLGVIPTGNLTAAERRSIVKIMKDKKAYSYKLIETNRSGLLRRPTHQFQVTISPVGYITALKEFSAVVGLNHLKDINPDDYASADSLVFTVLVDGWTHQMTQIDQSAGSRSEDISGRNLRKVLPESPKNTISVDELQTRLQAVE